jgi:predicted membrane protein
MKEKFYRFMQGRYGNDEMSKFLLGISMALIILKLLTKSVIFDLLFWVCLIYSYFRMFSKNYSARYAENQKFLAMKNKWMYKWENHKRMREQKKIYHIYSCPYCKQKIRIPKGKGSIIITCPKCKREFGKRS